MEILRPISPRRLRVALFDFDGTLSLIREGWQAVMISFMVRVLEDLQSGETEEELRRIVEDFVIRLTGKQTIYQMLHLAEEVKKRGGTPKDPLLYKQKYHELLQDRIRCRIEALESGKTLPREWLVPGSTDILENFRARGIVLCLASGTDEAFVKREVDLLRLTSYFDNHIYGALDEYQQFSKRLLIERIFREKNLKGEEFVAFGDGYVEIENTKEAGGLAVGVATDEVRRSGINPWKHQRLLEAGADIIVPDFREQEKLVRYITGQE